MRLPKTLAAWTTEAFAATAKSEIQSLHGRRLPLQQGLRRGSHALDDEFAVTVLGGEPTPQGIAVRVGIFYRSLISGCACADDPTPEDTCEEYCVLRFDIDGATAGASVTLLDDD